MQENTRKCRGPYCLFLGALEDWKPYSEKAFGKVVVLFTTRSAGVSHEEAFIRMSYEALISISELTELRRNFQNASVSRFEPLNSKQARNAKGSRAPTVNYVRVTSGRPIRRHNVVPEAFMTAERDSICSDVLSGKRRGTLT